MKLISRYREREEGPHPAHETPVEKHKQKPKKTQRLMRDFRRLQQDPPQGVNGSPTSDNILRWKAVIFGPEDTPWDGGEQREEKRDGGGKNGKERRRRREKFPPSTLTLKPKKRLPHETNRNLQAHARVHRGVPQPPAAGQVRLPGVPPQRLRRRRHLP